MYLAKEIEVRELFKFESLTESSPLVVHECSLPRHVRSLDVGTFTLSVSEPRRFVQFSFVYHIHSLSDSPRVSSFTSVLQGP